MTLVWGATFGDPNLKTIALKLADYAWDDGSNIFPSVATVSEATELDRRTVQRGLRKLHQLKLLTVKEGEAFKGGRGRSTRYTMDLAWLIARQRDQNSVTVTPIKERQPAALSTVKGVTGARKGVTLPPEPLEPLEKKALRVGTNLGHTALDSVPADWIASAKKENPKHSHMVADEAGKFLAWYAGEVRNDWDSKWSDWVVRFTRRPPGKKTARQTVQAWDSGPAPHDTTGGVHGFKAYTERMIAEGKFDPSLGRSDRR